MTSSRHDICLFLALVLLSGLLFLLPPAPRAVEEDTGFKSTAKVEEVDDSGVAKHDLVLFGTQRLKVKLLRGAHKGEMFYAENELRANLELDKLFKVGDRVIVVSSQEEIGEGSVLIAQNYARNGWTIILFGAFCILLCVFGRLTGFNALLSFVFSCLLIWKAVIPLVLRGWSASWTIFACVVFLTAVIMALVAGFTKCGICAFFGAISGVFVGLFTAHFFTWVMNINGATLPYSQALLFAGYENLNLQNIFVGAMILASSGAVMDLAMDISSGIQEVAKHNPTLGQLELTKSGLRMGRNVVGTMTTTLLLAYSGGYITLLMMFAAKGSSLDAIINNPLVAAEIVKTLIGSFSLVLVAPFTAMLGGWFFRPRSDMREA